MPRPNRGPRLSDKPNIHGIYEIKWTVGGRSQRVSTGASDYRAAQRFFVDWLPKHERIRDKEASGKLTVGEVLDLYLSGRVETKLAAPATARYSIANLKAHFGPIDAVGVEPGDVDRYVRKRETGKIGRPSVSSTIRRELGVLVAALNFVAAKKRLKKSDLPPIELPEDGEAVDRWLSPAEAAALETAVAERDWRTRLFVLIAIETAARKGAIEALTWFQVDFATGKINLNPRGRKQTKKRRPVVPISNRLRTALVVAKEAAKTEFVLGHPGNTRKAFTGAVKRAGLGADVTPHVLRHTWATWAAQRGVPLWKIAGVLGDTYATVERNYLHHCPDHLRDAVEYHHGGEDTEPCEPSQPLSSPA